MSITNTAVTVTDEATALGTVGNGRESLSISVPAGGATVYIGGASVTTANGDPLVAGQRVEISRASGFTLAAQEAWYGIVATGTQEVRVREVAG